MNLGAVKTVLAVATVVMCLLITVSAQDSRFEIQKDLRISLEMENEPLSHVFWELMVYYDLPIGFEESTLDSHHDDYRFTTMLPNQDKVLQMRKDKDERWKNVRIRKELRKQFGEEEYKKDSSHLVSINVRDKRLDDVLNILVKQMVHYQWEIDDGVVNIFPAEGRDKRFQSLLGLRIEEFYTGAGARNSNVRSVLYGLPLFNAFLEDNNLCTSDWRWNPQNGGVIIAEELRFSNLSFKELLNGIVRKRRGGWILRSKKPAKQNCNEYIEILI